LGTNSILLSFKRLTFLFSSNLHFSFLLKERGNHVHFRINRMVFFSKDVLVLIKIFIFTFWVKPQALRFILSKGILPLISINSLFLFTFRNMFLIWHQTTNGRTLKNYCLFMLKPLKMYVFKPLFTHNVRIAICRILNSVLDELQAKLQHLLQVRVATCQV